MSKATVISRLEELLARVRTRSAEGHDLLQTMPVPAHAPSLAASPGAPAPLAKPARADSALEPEITVAFEVQETEIDLSEPFEDAPVARALDSRERMVASEASAAGGPRPGADELLDDELAGPPSSSRRVIADEPEEQLSEMAFGAEDLPPPRHTPPPESGRLPAAPEVDLDADVTGVRHTAPTVPPGGGATLAPDIAPRSLTPQVTRASLGASQGAASVIGHAQSFAPKTFVELLDASLQLGS